MAGSGTGIDWDALPARARWAVHLRDAERALSLLDQRYVERPPEGVEWGPSRRRDAKRFVHECALALHDCAQRIASVSPQREELARPALGAVAEGAAPGVVRFEELIRAITDQLAEHGATRSLDPGRHDELASHAAEVAAEVLESWDAPADLGARVFRSCSRADVELLAGLASDDEWTDATPVAPVLAGRLWSGELPVDWPIREEQAADEALDLDIEIPPGATDEQIDELVKRAVGAADELHRAYGGGGLEVVRIVVREPQPAFAGAPA